MRLQSIFISYLRLPLVARLVLLALSSIFVFGSIIHFVEPLKFPTIFEGVWWAIVTVSTVGYGDYSPETKIGRIVGIMLILVGTGFMTLYFASLSKATVTKQNSYLEGATTFKGKNHIVLVGWNERIKETLHQLCHTKGQLSIVLIDESLTRNPVSFGNVTFIKGNPTHDDTLQRANIADAEMIVISADQSKNEVHADMATILTLVTAKGLNPSIYTIVEILTQKQIINAKRAGAEEVVETNRLSSFVITNSIVSHGISETLLVMLDHLAGNKIEYIKATTKEVGQSYHDIINQLIVVHILPIGIKRGDESYINPSPTFIIQEDDELLVIKH
ncbi:potassium channel family protein [Bacillus pinisoli]|uniref:potassium channel family protein n=1 Tax=Bacillus pinisoli TaxID=2901866 RepID=UPI001FF6C0CA|nr:potassium channel protein [Bacillus pinisoli]